ncbi:MAG: hypothetical protein JSU64_06755 [candidate division WOR-3 bacterium]|nr:MAG: hypothetical protein JSU64_06755 [candidate division WOR-3 bacterium]
MIEAYRFGEIVISGKTYHTDVIIYTDHVDSRWLRKRGHILELDDIRQVIDAHPDTVIFGTGQPGLMNISSTTIAEMEKLHIEMVIMPTEQACQEYNRIAQERKVIACLHLTC